MSEELRPSRALPASPDLDQQKKQARELLRAARAGDPAALRRFHEHHPRGAGRLALADAQLVLAREYGFASWPRLKAWIDRVSRPGPTRPYVLDAAWYEGRARGLAEMHKGALPNALAQIRAWHPSFTEASDAEIAAAELTLDDARLVYARQHGARDWNGLLSRVSRLRSGEAEPFAQGFAAIERREAERLRELLRLHPGLTAEQGTNGNSLLNLAVAIEKEDGPLVRTLLAAGADPNLPNDRGWTPLHQAASVNHPGLIALLLGAGAAVTVSAHGEGGTPLAAALFWGHQEAAALLAAVAVVPDNLRINAALDRAGHLSRFFREDGSLIPEAGLGRGFYRPHSGFPAWSPSDDRAEIVGEALSWAARNGALAAMGFLIDRGADVDASIYRGTPLMFAVAWRKPAAVQWLLEHGADPNRRAPFHGQEPGRATALHLAAQTDDPALVRMLLDHGADPTIRDENYNGDPAGWAEYSGARRTLELLRNPNPLTSSQE
jgi:ankyrin repeat protein